MKHFLYIFALGLYSGCNFEVDPLIEFEKKYAEELTLNSYLLEMDSEGGIHLLASKSLVYTSKQSPAHIEDLEWRNQEHIHYLLKNNQVTSFRFQNLFGYSYFGNRPNNGHSSSEESSPGAGSRLWGQAAGADNIYASIPDLNSLYLWEWNGSDWKLSSAFPPNSDNEYLYSYSAINKSTFFLPYIKISNSPDFPIRYQIAGIHTLSEDIPRLKSDSSHGDFNLTEIYPAEFLNGEFFLPEVQWKEAVSGGIYTAAFYHIHNGFLFKDTLTQFYSSQDFYPIQFKMFLKDEALHAALVLGRDSLAYFKEDSGRFAAIQPPISIPNFQKLAARATYSNERSPPHENLLCHLDPRGDLHFLLENPAIDSIDLNILDPENFPGSPGYNASFSDRFYYGTSAEGGQLMSVMLPHGLRDSQSIRLKRLLVGPEGQPAFLVLLDANSTSTSFRQIDHLPSNFQKELYLITRESDEWRFHFIDKDYIE